MAELQQFDVPEGGESEDIAAPDTGVSRRALVKAGAVTAWTVPLIQVIAAAPAHAATSTGAATPKLLLGKNKTSASYSSQGSVLTVSVEIHDVGSAPRQNLQVTLSFPNAPKGWAASLSTSPGWSPSTGTGWTFTADTQLSNGGKATLVATFTVAHGQGAALDIDVSATALGAASAGTSIHVAAA